MADITRTREEGGFILEPSPTRPGPPAKIPLLHPAHNYETVTRKITSLVFNRTPSGWYIGMAILGLGMMLFTASVGYLFARGVGIWGINIPVAWGFDIINFVWWIGIGHAGTLISAILLLLHQEWRTSINRIAESMTLFAVACAGMYPILHLGRPWLAYWLLPYPSPTNLWPQFRSPLVWDVFAVSTYATVSLLFWYTGLVPDLATMRDRTKNRFLRVVYGMGSLGWRGSARHWNNYQMAYLLLAGLSTPLVVSVHSVVSFDFAVSILPGWHSTIFPPYFVAGAIFAGFAMVLTIVIPLRAFYRLHDLITMRHIDNMAKVTLVTGLVVAYGYLSEIFFAYYSGEYFEKFFITNRITGAYAWSFWALILCNVIAPQFLWSKRVRHNLPAVFLLMMFVNIGMWLERFVIIVGSLHRGHLPSSWAQYAGTFWDWSLFLGTMALFLFLFFLFIRALPAIAIFETRELIHPDQSQTETPA
ncbi:MAG: polysulfide reductase NrfD [Chloroflexota bacterium]|nr:polysulfide reductase NrfD [Chloroflexota bacterium]